MPKYPLTFADKVDLEISPPLDFGTGDSLANDIAIPDLSTIDLVLTVNASQFTLLLSAAMTGAFIENPNDWQNVVYPLIKAGKTMALSSCEDVANCINSNEETQLAISNVININTSIQQSIYNILNNSGSVNPNRIDETTTGADRIPDSATTPIATAPPDCNLDALWAGIREIVTRLDDGGRDVLEDLQYINDKIQQWSELVDLVPLLGDIIKDVGDLFTEQVPDLLDAYNSASSETFMDNVACELFAMVCNLCRYPTYDEIFGYLNENSLLNLDVLNLLTYAATWQAVSGVTALVPEQVWFTINVWQTVTLAFDANFRRSYGRRTFGIWASLGEDYANNNWEVLCGGCSNEWCYEFDFSINNGNFVLVDNTNIGTGQAGNRGVYITATEWRSSIGTDSTGAAQGGCIVCVDMGAQVNLTYGEVEFSKFATTFNYDGKLGVQNVGEAFQPLFSHLQGTAAQNNTVLSGFADVTGRYLRIEFIASNSDPNKYNRIHRVLVRGTGTNPFGADNCV